ncbi:MAG: Riboflavin synthase [Candidatus Dichloromethanomonas elyunquensis]|nr:MAG: Riboflavin synthase [Candidatus Dichloromethanomonas elyunquensis]
MFTGIIEELGTVQKLDTLKDSARLTVQANKVLIGSQIGDSIAVNGVCLTVTDRSNSSFSVDIMFETLQKTNLYELKNHSNVNLERALQLQTRLGGHLVSGHVDGTGRIASIHKTGIANIYEIHTSKNITHYLLPKGSVAVDGISLTLVDIEEDRFTVSLIPHTFAHTTLGFKGPGSTVNLETDLIGKYVAKFLNPEKDLGKKDITLDYLSQHGFID